MSTKQAAQPVVSASPGEVKMLFIHFAQKGMNLWVRDAADKVMARSSDTANGFDIYYDPHLLAYRVEKFEVGALVSVKHVNREHVAHFERFDEEERVKERNEAARRAVEAQRIKAL